MRWNAEQEIVIVGAGISGLACAQFMRMRGADPLVLEAGKRAGGKLWSEDQEGFLLEHGPASLRGAGPELRELVEALGLEERLVTPATAASRRFILRNGTPRQVPSSAGSFLRADLLSGGAKLRALAEPFVRRGSAARAANRPRTGDGGRKGDGGRAASEDTGATAGADESVSSFVTRRLGREVNDYAVEPFVAGIYAGDPDQLSVQSAFPMLSGLEARYGSVLRGALKARAAARRKRRDDGDARAGNSRGAGARTSGAGRSGQLTFRGGVSELPEAIAAALDERLLLEACVTAVRRSERGFELTVQQGRRERRLQAKQVVLAVPAYAAAELVRGVDGYASEALSRIPYPPILTVTVGVSAEAFPEPPEGFGLLIPRVERRSILGVIYAHSVFPHRAPEQGVLLTVFVGGSRDRELLRRYTAEELLQRTRAELRELFGLRAEPALLRHVLWERAIPQYTVGHEQRMAALRAAEERHRGLRFLGNYRGGVAVANCLAEARRTAEAVAGR